MKITVTKKHIKRGEPRSSENCPIALAIKERLHTRKVSVRATAIWIKGERFQMPISARSFITAFDSRDFDLRPFSFELVF